ncbi:MAG: hypothetical protein EOO43_06290 [Flavobacterium sp.]|nr:MAG: hypothetical protein EOO43_06290 [Flavobacterium sp.]
MKILKALLLSTVMLFALNSYAQSNLYLSMSKLLDIVTGFPEMKQKDIVQDLTTNFGFKSCELDKVSDKKILTQYRLCKQLPNGTNSNDFQFKGGSNKNDEIVSFVEYRILDENGNQTNLYESYLKSSGFANSYSDKEVKKYRGRYNGRDLVINIYTRGSYRDIKINNDPSY